LYFYKEALAIALPVMLQLFIMSMVSLIDNFMVAGLGDISMAAVNVTNHLVFVYFVIMNTICQAGGIYIAQFKGANDSEGMKHAFRFKVIFSMLAAVVFFILCRTIPDKMVAMMTTGNAVQEEIVAIGSGYLKLVSWTVFPIAVSTSIATSFREIARPKGPLFVSAAATFVNTFGNWLLIYGNLGAPRLEVTGAAYATIIARFIELVIFLIFLNAAKAPFSVGLGRLFNIRRELVAKILSKSAMIFVSEVSWISAETLMVAMYNRRGGAEVVAGMAAGWTIANIFFLLLGGIWTASTVLIGGSLGANKLDDARRRAGWLKSGAFAGGIIIALPGMALSAALIPLVFSNLSPDARSTCLGLVLVILAYLPLWAVLNTQFAISRAGGDTALGMYTDLFVNTLLFAPGAVILSFFTSLSPVPMFALLKVTDFVKYFVARYFMNKEKWVRNLTGN
jgi:putative MATE family efflux protein